MRSIARLASLVLCLGFSAPIFAGFQSTETYLVAVGRTPGQFGAQIYSTVWATNLTGAPNSFTVYFLKQGQANTSPASFSDSLAPGETKIYENIVQSKFSLTGVIGALRIVSSGEILVSERIYNQPSGADLGNTEGFFFGGVPKSFSISSGQSASIQGVNQGGSENFRSNFILVETGGASTTVNVQVFDNNGHQLGQKAYPLQAYEQLQGNVGEIVPSIATTNGRITATVTGGTGSALLAGAQVANESQDASGFEMSFRDSLLGTSGGTAGVTSLNGLTGAVSLIAGTNVTLTNQGNGIKIDTTGTGGSSGVTSLDALTGALTLTPGTGISITPSGSSINIAYTGGGSAGLTSVTHDASLTGAGTGTSPLAIANGQVVRSLTVGSSTLHDAVTLAAGSNLTLMPSGSTITIASTGLTLPFSGTASANIDFDVVNSSSGFNDTAIEGDSSNGFGVVGRDTIGGTGVQGSSNSGTGVIGGSYSGDGVYGNSYSADGVRGHSSSGNGVEGHVNNSSAGVAGVNDGAGPGIYGQNISGSGYAGDFYGDVTVSGNIVYGGSLIHSSDVRFKKDVEPLEDALERTLSLRGVTFDWRRDEFPERHFRTGRDIGVIAQEVETVYPELVVTDRDGYKSVDYSRLTPILVEAIKAQQKKIDAQQERLDELTERLERLEAAPRSTEASHKANSILDPDGRIILETTHRLGWDQQESWKRAEAEEKQ